MNADNHCAHPVVVHRVRSQGAGGGVRTKYLFECVDPACDARPDDHELELPCAWSWPLAHGRKYNGESFPRRRCPGCYHIQRRGVPDAVHDVG